ncbi:MAG: TetM/TetW/TetO/TetS family tetracycline resistance ribosomal protection protein [Clostridiales bacterium]|nr:TetM/TetW/TetO/TetS family tetracycline resistance ribosomal protection protein [Clostridiales bacterium]
MLRLVIGMLAHVDAGKTTLSEALLYKSGALRRMGRVDHRDAFLDTHEIEKERGITIFSKQAQMELPGRIVTLMDTPGHVDFSAEAERALTILDYAILVVSGSEGVQTHTLLLWQLLKKHRVPTFVFVNKTDLPCPSKEALISSLRARLDGGFVDFTADTSARDEDIAACSESLMDEFLESGGLLEEHIASAIRLRQVFPVYFGSALKLAGIDEFISGLARLTIMREYPKDFGARVYKVTHSEGTRLTFMKITGGSLRAKQLLTNLSATVDPDEVWQEKADQIRLYSGSRYTQLQEALPGTVCAVTGLTKTYAGEGLGAEAGEIGSVLSPVLSYSLEFPEGTDLFDAYRRISPLMEEDPALGIVWDEQHGSIHAQLMGEVQCEVLKKLIKERFGLDVSFGVGAVMYKETVSSGADGIGHFEPLRHYAHVELRIEPAPAGSGLSFASEVPQNELAGSWQRLIMTHLAEKRHKGVLTGSPLTDVRIVLTGGKAHLKHTEGGDFRKATYRAVRNALMFSRSVLLEPYYSFTLELPTENIGRAMNDIRRMEGEFAAPQTNGDTALLTGEAPVSSMRDYGKTVAAYTHGRGVLQLAPADYRPCHNAEEVIREIGYDPEADIRNTPDSVFCAAGAGFTVKWYEVADYMKRHSAEPGAKMPAKKPVLKNEDDELMAIFERTYGKVGETRLMPTRKQEPKPEDEPREAGEEYLLIDGYNVIFSWDSLRSIAEESIDLARETLIRMMINYQGVRRTNLILVFDAYKVTGGAEKVDKVGDIYIVYTRESELADVFIERAVQKLSKTKRNIRVVTSDGMEQLIVMSRGALRVPAPAFEKEVGLADERLKDIMKKLETEGKTVLHLWQRMIGDS